jgi:hypothetical protein
MAGRGTGLLYFYLYIYIYIYIYISAGFVLLTFLLLVRNGVGTTITLYNLIFVAFFRQFVIFLCLSTHIFHGFNKKCHILAV